MVGRDHSAGLSQKQGPQTTATAVPLHRKPSREAPASPQATG